VQENAIVIFSAAEMIIAEKIPKNRLKFPWISRSVIKCSFKIFMIICV